MASLGPKYLFGPKSTWNVCVMLRFSNFWFLLVHFLNFLDATFITITQKLLNYLLNITHFYDHKTAFCLVIIGTVWHLFVNFEMKRPKKRFLEYSTHYPKWILKNQKFENLNTTHTFNLDLGPKDIWVQEILLLEVWLIGGRN